MANGPEFFQTIMGRAFYEGTMPRLVKQLEKLNENIEKLAEAKATPAVQQSQPPYLLLDESLDYFEGSEEPGFFNRALLDHLSTEVLQAELEERGAPAVVHAGQKVILKGAQFLGDKLDPKELANTSESLKPVPFSLATETAEEAFKRAQDHIEKVRLQAISDNEREWVILCKRTHDPKLSWLERTLSAHGILNRRNGFSFHAPILQVPAEFENKAQLILALVDDMDDDEDPFYVGER